MFLDVTQLHRDYLNQVGSVDMKQLLSLYETMLDSMTTRISSSLTKYDLYLLTVTPVVMFLVSPTILSIGLHRHENYFNTEGFIEKSSKIKSALKNSGKSLLGLENSLIFNTPCRT